MSIRLIDDKNPIEEVALGGTTFRIRKLLEWDDVEMNRKATADGKVDELALYCARWRHLFVGAANLLDCHGEVVTDFAPDSVCRIREEDGKRWPVGIGPALGADVARTLLSVALAPLVEGRATMGNSHASSPSGEEETASTG